MAIIQECRDIYDALILMSNLTADLELVRDKLLQIEEVMSSRKDKQIIQSSSELCNRKLEELQTEMEQIAEQFAECHIYEGKSEMNGHSFGDFRILGRTVHVTPEQARAHHEGAREYNISHAADIKGLTGKKLRLSICLQNATSKEERAACYHAFQH